MRAKSLAILGLAMAASFSSAAIFDVTTSWGPGPISTYDNYGDPDNIWFNTDMGVLIPGYTNFHVIGIGWNVNITTYGNSWLSESSLAFENTAQTAGVFLSPGAGDDFGGTNVNYSSGGVVDLVGLSLDFFLDADNKLRQEWFDSFDDNPNAVDSDWLSGSEYTVRVEADAVPEPASMAVLGLGAAALLRRRRK